MIRLFILLIVLCTVSCAELKPTFFAEVHTDKSKKKKLDQYFTKLTDLKQFNGVVSVHDDGEDFFLKAYNLNADSKSSTYVTTQSQFDIHSVSKLIAKMMVLELEQEGLLAHTDYLSKYISDFPNGHKITIQHLLDNSSGLPREPSLVGVTKKELSQEEIIEWAKKEKLQFEPGTDKLYSNVGYELLYYIIGKQTNTSFGTYAELKFFPKLKMFNSGSRFASLMSDLSHLAKNHQYDQGIVVVPNVTEDDFRQSMLFATADDLQRFLDYASKEPFSKRLKSDNGIIGWSGGGDGIRSHVQLNTKKNYSFVILANYDEIPIQAIIDDVSKIMEDKSVELPKEVERTEQSVSESILERYVGAYEFKQADNLILEVKLEKGSLQLYQDGGKIAELLAESETVFFYDPESADSFEFQLNENGKYDVKMGWKGVKLNGVLIE